MKKLLFLLFLLVLFLCPVVFAKQGHMKLLAVRETEDGYEGGIADLYLDVRPGSGRVFLETFPLTRTDTQMSTRFAKAIACDALERDCDDVDFFYTIDADSAIIAGPSAGASIAVLTVAMLEDLELNEDYSLTGTINPGGLIGPVGGLKAKVEAAKKAGLKKVFIPAGELIVRANNSTTDLRNISRNLGVEIIEVSTLSEAVKEFTGKEIRQKYSNIDIDEEYKNTMKSLAKQLCDRSSKLKSEVRSAALNFSSIKENAQNLTNKGKDAFKRQTFYSSASYCFGANVEYSTLAYLSKNMSVEGYKKEISRIEEELKQFEIRIERHEKKTITDLEAYIAVKERLSDAQDSISQVLGILNSTNSTTRIARMLAYAGERINSANSWAAFLGKPGKAFNLNKDVIKKSCQSKISEAEEGKQYVELYFPNTLENVKKEIERATEQYDMGNYEICLSIASKAKADVGMVLGVFGVDPAQYTNIAERKLEIVRNNIAKQSSNGIFPILGYSYYEYANSLKNSDVFSALIYSEYALELGNLDIYFKETSTSARINERFSVDTKWLGAFAAGLIVGFIASSLISKRRKIKEKVILAKDYKPKQNK